MQEGIRKGTIPVAVVGLGHVGLPLALLLAEQGARVNGCELEGEYLGKLRRGISPIVEHGSSRFADRVLEESCPTCGVRILQQGSESFCPNCMKVVEVNEGRARVTGKDHEARGKSLGNEMQTLLVDALKSKKLSLVSDAARAARSSGIVIVCVGTPIDHDKRPDLRALVSAARSIGKGLRRGSLVILKSTVSPGTTEGVFAPLLERGSGLKMGKDFGLAHVPETTLEGLALLGHRTLPKTVGGVDRRSSELAAAVFGLFSVPTFMFESPRITEAAKLFQNIYRDVNVALANELALASETLGLDMARVLEAARTEPKTHMLNPGPGVGGYCLPKDAFYIIHPARSKGFRPGLLKEAREVNNRMPGHVVSLAAEGLAEAGLTLRGSKVAVLGVSFKANTADTRDTPSLPVIRKLASLGAKVSVHDPLADVKSAVAPIKGATPATSIVDAVRGAEALVLLTDHLEYRALNGKSLKRMAPGLKVVVDTRQVFDPDEVVSLGYTYKGVGRVPQHSRGRAS